MADSSVAFSNNIAKLNISTFLLILLMRLFLVGVVCRWSQTVYIKNYRKVMFYENVRQICDICPHFEDFMDYG